MTVNELIDKLTEIKKEDLGELLVAGETFHLTEITECKLELSKDGVGQYIRLS